MLDALTNARDVAGGLTSDLEFLNTIRRTPLTIPWESHGAEGEAAVT